MKKMGHNKYKNNQTNDEAARYMVNDYDMSMSLSMVQHDTISDIRFYDVVLDGRIIRRRRWNVEKKEKIITFFSKTSIQVNKIWFYLSYRNVSNVD